MTKIILFPYAGSLGLAYNQWVKPLKRGFEVHRICYTELKEGCRNYQCSTWDELTDLMFRKVSRLVKDGDYIFFGHSMGSRAAYEMYKKLYEYNMPLPEKMILSGCQALNHPVKNPEDSTEEQFRNEYISLGGISEEVLACDELAELAFTELRKDVMLLKDFSFEYVPVQCPVVVLNGSKDTISSKEEWENLLQREVEWKLYSGKHFFIYDYQDEIIENLLAYAEWEN